MNRSSLFVYLILFNIVLLGCSTPPAKQIPAISDAGSYMRDGVKAFAKADRNRAEWYFSKALELYQSIDDQQGVLFSHINLAEVALSARDYQATQMQLNSADVLAQTAPLQTYQPRISLLFAQSALQQKDYALAEKILHSLLPEFNELTLDKIPDIIQLTAIANRTKIAFITQQDESIWTQRYANALAMSTNKSPDLAGLLLRFQAEILQHQGKSQEAVTLLQQALLKYKTNFSRSGIAATLAELGQLAMTQGHWQDAQNYFIRSNKVFRYIGDFDKVIENTQHLVKIATALGHLERSNQLRAWLAKIQDEQMHRAIKK